ncbi:Clavaminate synthase-like protein [Pluteus cervinus]|uniref:Clavaminate synthase-like protein n=1 Tax=Pluteus cervinus TaxID=181527 RepID=A0ACD3BFB1_9AGAR|nr:Clavaminate synthase-like protein [Pluteus cervinus]
MTQHNWQFHTFQLIAQDVEQTTDPDLAPLSSCGELFRSLLSIVSQYSEGDFPHTQYKELDELVTTSSQQLGRTQPGTEKSWRRLHTDASILRAIVSLGAATARECIAILDRAIILSGAADHARLDLIQDLITRIQRQYLPLPLFEQSTVPAPTAHDHKAVCTATRAIEAWVFPPSLTTFQRQSCRQPFIVRGYAADWPALNAHPWFSARYLRHVAGSGRIVPVEVGMDYRAKDWTQKIMDWDSFISNLDLADNTPPPGQKETLYLAQHNLFTQFPALKADIITPDYVYADIPSSYFPGRQLPNNPDQFVCNSWLGPRGTATPAHTDPYLNLFVQVVGKKTVWTAPPEAGPSMYSYSSLPGSGLSNTSQVDVFSSSDEQGGEYGEFWEKVVPHAQSATLNAGDLLYLPPGWWHAMRSESTSFSVSTWF